MHIYVEGQLCEKCGDEIGRESYTLLQDGINRHLHKFHARCAPKDPDVQRHHGLSAEPLVFNAKALTNGIV